MKLETIELTREELAKIVRDAYLSGMINLKEEDEYVLDIVHHLFKFKQTTKL